MKRPTCIIALAYSCHGLPGPWQTPFGLDLSSGRGRRDEARGGRGAFGSIVEQSGLAASQAHHKVVVEDNKGWDYFTDIRIGNPPQSFRAAVDIGWSDTLVPSVRCNDPDCTYHRLYDSARSSSYQENGTAVEMVYSGFYTSGYASTDTMRVGDLTIANQSFEEATKLKAVPFWDDVFDSVLGLSRLELADPESSLRATSPFHNMIRQGLLERNLFSLKLSESDADVKGELLFGNVNNDLYVGPLTSFPVTTTYSTDRIANAYLSPGWQVAAHSISIRHNDNAVANFSLDGYVATFSTLSPWISIPTAVAERITEHLGADQFVRQLDCARREELPDLVISLGHTAVPFVLKPHDYIRKSPQLEWSNTCQVEIADNDEPEDGVKYIILGSVFLARWYSVFDYDNAQISFASLSG